MIKRFLKRIGLYNFAWLLWRILRGRPFFMWNRRRKIRNFYRKILPRGDRLDYLPEQTPRWAFDVGANYGVRTAILRSLGYSVVAIEPQPECVHALREKFSGDADVIIRQVAVGEKDGFATMNTIPGITTIGSLCQQWPDMKEFSEMFKNSVEIQVQVTTLDRIIGNGEFGPLFCKIDVEGYEPETLRGLSARIPLVSFEFHRRLINHIAQCVKEFDRIGGYMFNYAQGENDFFDSKEWLGGTSLIEAIATLPEGSWGDVYARSS